MKQDSHRRTPSSVCTASLSTSLHSTHSSRDFAQTSAAITEYPGIFKVDRQRSRDGDRDFWKSAVYTCTVLPNSPLLSQAKKRSTSDLHVYKCITIITMWVLVSRASGLVTESIFNIDIRYPWSGSDYVT